MASDDAAPLLSEGHRSATVHHEAEENTPLLSRLDVNTHYDGTNEGEDTLHSPAATSLRSIKDRDPSSNKTKKPWIIITSIILLISTAIIIAFGVYIAPSAVEEYAKQAMVIEPTDLSIESFTSNGVRARIRANFRLDASKVADDNIRNIGRAGTWIARTIESESSTVRVYLPHYNNILLGSATIPNLQVDIRNGKTTNIDFVADLVTGDVNGIKGLVNDWLEGRLGQLEVVGKAEIALKSGIFALGSTTVSDSMVFEGQSLYKAFASLFFGEKRIA